MGLRPFLRSSGKIIKSRPLGAPIHSEDLSMPAECNRCLVPVPDPGNYKIVRSKAMYGNLLVKIKYPDCTNYEGNKILLYRNTTLKQLKAQKYIDPHFMNSKRIKSPVARFEPTKAGWTMGLVMLTRI